ncbi:MAG: hypothetical protein DRR42_28295 [Gammaproteobacteria bacterium]|nr:MAG: hypothetical protein DRR42_28295 [Gammaproteobacteria bacterium]
MLTIDKTAGITVDAFSPSDYAAAATLWVEALGNGFDPEFDTAERITGYLRRNPGLSSAARVGEALIGTVLCGHDGRRGSLYHLAVHRDLRRRGVARQVVERSVGELRKIGIHSGFCFTLSENSVSQRALESVGFEYAPTVQYRYKGFGKID